MKRFSLVSLIAALSAAFVMLSACGDIGSLQPAVESAVGTIAEVATSLPAAEAQAEPETAEPATGHTTAAHWTYEGEAGAQTWATPYPDCGGVAQSPIDLTGAEAMDMANLVLNYQPSGITIRNNGHTVQVDMDPGSTIELDGQRYRLAQFHFHAPSEHTIDGQPAAAELHLVHVSDDTQPASPKVVVGVLIKVGADNPVLSAVWDNLYAANATPQPVNGTINAADLLPATQTRYHYTGSLTTPPCTEGIDWNVMTEPIEMSQAQLDAYIALFKGATNRPVQRLNDRALSIDSTP